MILDDLGHFILLISHTKQSRCSSLWHSEPADSCAPNGDLPLILPPPTKHRQKFQRIYDTAFTFINNVFPFKSCQSVATFSNEALISLRFPWNLVKSYFIWVIAVTSYYVTKKQGSWYSFESFKYALHSCWLFCCRQIPPSIFVGSIFVLGHYCNRLLKARGTPRRKKVQRPQAWASTSLWTKLFQHSHDSWNDLKSPIFTNTKMSHLSCLLYPS